MLSVLHDSLFFWGGGGCFSFVSFFFLSWVGGASSKTLPIVCNFFFHLKLLGHHKKIAPHSILDP